MWRQGVMGVMIFLMWGCSQSPPLQRYTLMAPQVKTTLYKGYQKRILKISYPQAILTPMDQKMHFSYSMHDRGSYLHSQWIEESGRLLQGVLVASLDVSGRFYTVVPMESSLVEDYRLESRLFAFEHRIRDGDSRAIFSVSMTLMDSKYHRVIKTRRFFYQQPTRSTDAKGYAEATNRIMEQWIGDLLKWL
jgi:ABC-type uncharacterized transport system auxiliary subunit